MPGSPLLNQILQTCNLQIRRLDPELICGMRFVHPGGLSRYISTFYRPRGAGF